MSFSPDPNNSCNTLFRAESDIAKKWLADPWLSVNPKPFMVWKVESGYKLICEVGSPETLFGSVCFWNRTPALGSVSQKEGLCPLAEKPNARSRQKKRVDRIGMVETFEVYF
jgi:hypothetical protein